MHSIPLAMSWEFWRRGCWQFLLALGAMLALPSFVFASLLLVTSSRLEVYQESLLSFHLVCLIIQAMTFGVSVLALQENVSQFYTWPTTASSIVTWRLLPGMAAMALLNLITSISVNLMFGAHWPLVGPALFMACAYPVFQAAIWLGRNVLALQVFALSVLAVFLGAWLRARFGVSLAHSGPMYEWTDVTSTEMITMVSVAAAGWAGAWIGVRRDRRGESLRWLWLKDWIESWSYAGRSDAAPFRSPVRAQFWFEWRQKGFLMPAVVIVGIAAICLVVVVRHIWFDRADHEDLTTGIAVTGVLLPIIGLLVGMALGQTGEGRDKTVMGSFLASRPVEDRMLAHVTLIVGGLSAILAWALWLGFVLAVDSLFKPADPIGFRQRSIEEIWPLLFALLPLTWLGAALATCIVQTGRRRLMAQLLSSLFTLLIGWYFLTGPVWKLGPLAAEIPVALFGPVAVVGTLAAFGGAVYRRMISAPTAVLTLCVWFAASVALESQVQGLQLRQGNDVNQILLAMSLYGLLALAVAPVALGPLAVSWNRHR